jgi:excisionase family DNA binding protein
VDEILTPSQVASLLQIHVKTVYRLASEGVIPGSRIGRSWRFRKDDILGLVSRGETVRSPAKPKGDLAQYRKSPPRDP